MKKKKTPEFDPDLLASVAPEKREEFKKVVRKKRYLSSMLFLFIWNATLWAYSFPLTVITFKLFGIHGDEFFSFYSRSIFALGPLITSFFIAVALGFMTTSMRKRLNQTGIHVAHVLFASLPVVYGVWWVIENNPARDY